MLCVLAQGYMSATTLLVKLTTQTHMCLDHHVLGAQANVWMTNCVVSTDVQLELKSNVNVSNVGVR